MISWLHHQLELELRLAQACTLHVLTQEVNHSRRLRLVFYGVANFAVAAQNGPVSLEIACSSIPAQPQAMCSLLLLRRRCAITAASTLRCCRIRGGAMRVSFNSSATRDSWQHCRSIQMCRLKRLGANYQRVTTLIQMAVSCCDEKTT